MLSFIFRRFAQAVLVMLVVGMGAFSLFQYVGDPVSNRVGQDATPVQRERLHVERGRDRPAPVQFARFVGHALTGDFGLSLRQGREVSVLIAERLPATLELSLVAALIATLAGIPLGAYAALRRRHRDAKLTMAVSLLGVALPTFLIGIALIEVFARPARLVSQLRARRHGTAWCLEHRPAHGRRLASHRSAGIHAGRVPVRPGDAIRARGDARGLAL